MSDNPTIRQAIRAIASVCDGAITEDYQGFNAGDTSFGRFLAQAPPEHWTPEVLVDAYEMLRTYRVQLEGFDINYDDLEPPSLYVPEGTPGGVSGEGRKQSSGWYLSQRKIKEKRERLHKIRYIIPVTDGPYAGNFAVYFKWNAEVLAAVKGIDGRKWQAAKKFWSVPMASWSQLKETVLDPFDFSYSTDHEKAGWDAERRGKLQLVERAEPPAQVTWDDEEGHFVARFPYNPRMVDGLKALPRQYRRWDPECKGGKAWTIEPVAARKFAILIEETSLTISTDAAERLAGYVEEHVASHEASHQLDAEVEVDGLGMVLRPYQKAGVAYAVKHNRTFIADAMGLGKTAQAIASAHHTAKFPVVVVCPAGIKIQWTREIAKWLPEATTHIIAGQAPYDLPESDFYIINYDILSHWVDHLASGPIRTLVFDESHFIKNPTAQRTMAAFKLAEVVKDDDNIYLLTGTPIENRPFEFIAQLNVLGMLDLFGGYQKFRSTYCWNDNTRSYDGARNLGDLNEILRANCYVRRLKSEVLSELPAKQRAYLHVDPDPEALRKYKRAESDMTDWLRERAKQIAIEEGIDFTKALTRLKKAASSEAEALVRIAALRQLSALAKLKSVVSWIQAQEEPVVIFAHHRAVVERIAEAFDCPKIYGGMKPQDKQNALDSFVNGDTDIIVCSIDAAGVGIDGLQRASNVLFVEPAWNPSKLEQAEDRLHRIGQEGSVTCWYARLDVAIDEYIFEMLKAKRAVVDAAMNGGTLEDDGTASAMYLIGRFMEAQIADTPTV